MSPRSPDRRPLHYAGAQPGLSEAGQGSAAPAPESPPTQRYPGLLASWLDHHVVSGIDSIRARKPPILQ